MAGQHRPRHTIPLGASSSSGELSGSPRRPSSQRDGCRCKQPSLKQWVRLAQPWQCRGSGCRCHVIRRMFSLRYHHPAAVRSGPMRSWLVLLVPSLPRDCPCKVSMALGRIPDLPATVVLTLVSLCTWWKFLETL